MFSSEQVGKKVMTSLRRMFQLPTLILGILASLWLFDPVSAANKPPLKGGLLPPIRLVIPKDASERDYLGISGEGYFKIPEIKASILIIEIFSHYCPQCQASAPEVNALHQMIQEVPDLKAKIKMIGIGAGNTVLEVNAFKEKYKIPFSLFPDEHFKIHKEL